MTIEQAMQKIVALAGNAVAHAREGSTQWAEQTIEDLEATLTALVAQARDEEAEACAEIVMAEQATPHGIAYCEAAIRARIAGRKDAQCSECVNGRCDLTKCRWDGGART